MYYTKTHTNRNRIIHDIAVRDNMWIFLSLAAFECNISIFFCRQLYRYSTIFPLNISCFMYYLI